MDIKQLEYFVEAMRSNSFTRAADTLYITQQGISKSIKRLEEELGVPLFTRSSSAIVPTQYAEVFLPYAIDIIGGYKNGISAIDDMKIQSERELRIGISPGLVNLLSSDVLTEFMSNNHTINITLSEFSDDALDKAIENELVDVGLCILPVDETNLTVHYVRQEPTRYLVSEKHRLAGRKSVSLGELKDELFMGFGTRNKGHRVLEERCQKFGFNPKIGIQTQDIHMIEDLVRKNMGISFYIGDKNPVVPGLKVISDDSGDWFYRVGVTTKKGKPIKSEIKKLIQALKEW